MLCMFFGGWDRSSMAYGDAKDRRSIDPGGVPGLVQSLISAPGSVRVWVCSLQGPMCTCQQNKSERASEGPSPVHFRA